MQNGRYADIRCGFKFWHIGKMNVLALFILQAFYQHYQSNQSNADEDEENKLGLKKKGDITPRIAHTIKYNKMN